MDAFKPVQQILAEILDIEPGQISAQSYLVRELGAESIDLLELSVTLNSRFKVEINDDEIFLRPLRLYINEANENQHCPATFLAEKFPFLPAARIKEILSDLQAGPVLKVKDLIRYLTWQIGKR